MLTVGRNLKMPFRVSKEVLDEVHSRHNESSLMWELKAVELRYSMEVLFRQIFADVAVKLQHRARKSLRPSMHPVALMLAGMMIECYAKAVLVERKKLKELSRLKNHNLREAVKIAGYSPTAEEAAFLGRLSEFVRWAGRYPVPWKPEHMALDDERGNRNIVGASFLGSDLVMARSIADALESQIQAAGRVRKGTRSPSSRSSADPRRKQRRQ
jgi:hypothetical protein